MIIFGNNKVSIEDIVAVAKQQVNVALSDDKAFIDKIAAGAKFIQTLLDNEGSVYGVTTGYGDSVTQSVPVELVNELPIHLSRFHGCGLGAFFDEQEVRSILTVRLVSLCQGFSGVRTELLQQIVSFIQHDILPMIPEEGSVGASGDLTPLSYLAATLMGERKVLNEGIEKTALDVLKEKNIAPLMLKPKEALAIMNGTAVMTAVSCLNFDRAHYIAELACKLTAMSVVNLHGNKAHFDERLFAVKPHLGQQLSAKNIREDIHYVPDYSAHRLQDRYSLRCAPHVIGVLFDALTWMRGFIENEINSANDNPIIDPTIGAVLHGGHFYGGHIAFAMDSLKNAVANIADLLDRQMALLVDTKYSQGLPANLSGSEGARKSINHGLKALQIGMSAWTAEALKNTMPASVFSRSTECHNQDKVSMGTIASRDCRRVIELVEQVCAALLVANTQAYQLRLKQNESFDLDPSLEIIFQDITDEVNFIEEDRPIDLHLRQIISDIRAQKWTLYV